MKAVYLAILLASIASCQTKPKSPAAVLDGGTSTLSYVKISAPNVYDGASCLAEYALQVNDLSHIFVYSDATRSPDWQVPSDQEWSCVDGKWHRGLIAETMMKEANEVIDSANENIAKRKLTSQELKSLGMERKYPRPEIKSANVRQSYYTMPSWPLHGDYYCRSDRTADLIAQLSFWNPPPTDAELPLAMLEGYVKGMTCDAGTAHAYDIMNERIVAWLKKQEK